ncbi:hypothetical protein [Desulfospira joergensenii]|uniref:hypothetical protein n=1 Tax=Desulfospira joergensenii TaxID=53329 RepID=UPI0003B445BA|nr:hypothetical protein [Desulfospira joergensenii]
MTALKYGPASGLRLVKGQTDRVDPSREVLRNILGIETGSGDRFIRSLPFCAGDATAGAENEFQAVVEGRREDLDLPLTLLSSNYYKNIVKRAKSGDTSGRSIAALEKFLSDINARVWENSWVRFPRRALNSFANQVFNSDLKADKSDPSSGYRKDANAFVFENQGEAQIRIPVSYLLKLALADAVGDDPDLSSHVRDWGEKMMDHFSNDNSSPELFSFHPVKSDQTTAGLGEKLASETLLRFLLTQVLVAYAHEKFFLRETGQKVRVFFSSTPPMRQKQLNNCISDSFYRELFMSPCLSGWDRGEEKKDYMNVCHRVLSRSQLNGVAKLKEAGIITSNLVVLPNTSNISLANNGTHISLGSLKLSGLMADPKSGFKNPMEKYMGDLVIKVCEHFLPLFPGIYSASPFRLEFKDFHPEQVLGFLPHELDYTHLRMLWRKWKKKASIKVMGSPLTPFGPVLLDTMISRVFNLKGDFVPDFRLVDYFASIMSTFESPALDGRLESEARLKKDLTEMGIFDERMPLYQLIRLRKYGQMGYSGFEHRYFSIFENVLQDMGNGANLQLLITSLAHKYILSGEISHAMIPDVPEVESERRQIFYCTAINLPSFYIRTQTKNSFLAKILKIAGKTKKSRRYPGFTQVRVREYQKGLIHLLKTDGASLMEAFKMEQAIQDLERRIVNPERYSAWGKLCSGILDREGSRADPMTLTGQSFNRRAETFYTDKLRKIHIAQGFELLGQVLQKMDLWATYREKAYGDSVRSILGNEDLLEFLRRARSKFEDETMDPGELKKLIYLIILVVGLEKSKYEASVH